MCCSCCMSVMRCSVLLLYVFVEQKTAYEMRISDWSSDVCSSDLALIAGLAPIRVDPTDVEVADSAMRLMRLLDRRASIPVLREQLVREMHYWLLAGQHGTAIRQDRKSTRLNSSH